MKAPDKIYVSHLIYDTWQYTTPDPDDETEVEYIRKDALLEWLDGKLTVEGATEGFVGGYDSALKDVIDKLNSL